MTKINWKVRLKNKATLVALISGAFLLAQQILAMFGINWDYTALLQQITGAIGTVFTLLAILGVVTDPTTAGVTDSEQALTYDQPKEDDK